MGSAGPERRLVGASGPLEVFGETGGVMMVALPTLWLACL